MRIKTVLKYLFGAFFLLIGGLLAAYLIAPKWLERTAIDLVYPTISIQEEHRGKFTVEVPAVYELMYIACTLTETFQQDDNLINRRYADYLTDVEEHFRPLENHELVRYLDRRLKGAVYGPLQPSVRIFSVNYALTAQNKLVEKEVIHLNPLLAYLFKDRIFDYREQTPLIEDFAQAADFFNFYQRHQGLYAELADRYHRLCYFEATHRWLEDRFDAEYDSYRTIFSPLAGGFHNTIPGLKEPASGRQQTLMFVSPPANIDLDTLSPSALEIVASKACRKVFTEIDHNYVNPLSDNYLAEIEAAIPDHRLWNQQEKGYNSAYSTFNEYMTWGVFSLYARDTYAPHLLDSIVSFQEDYMVEHRQFVRFREFNQELTRLYGEQLEQGNKQIEPLYLPILSWMRSQTRDREETLEE